MVAPLLSQIMDLATNCVKGTLVRGSEEGFATIPNLDVVVELVKNKDFILKNLKNAKDRFKDRPRTIPRRVFQ